MIFVVRPVDEICGPHLCLNNPDDLNDFVSIIYIIIIETKYLEECVSTKINKTQLGLIYSYLYNINYGHNPPKNPQTPMYDDIAILNSFNQQKLSFFLSFLQSL